MAKGQKNIATEVREKPEAHGSLATKKNSFSQNEGGVNFVKVH